MITNSLETYHEIFNNAPEAVIFAPGRINLIGEHTDYSDGFVLPIAIDLGVTIAISPIEENRVDLFSTDFNDRVIVDLETFQKSDDNWHAYLKGIIWALQNKGYRLKGWQGVIAGDIPIGAGLSSSAATEVALIRAFMYAANLEILPQDVARIGRKAEQEWVGVNVGIMDQLISAAGKKDHAVLLDCRTLNIEYIPVPNSIQLIVLDTKTRRELSHSAYNSRQKEVEQAASLLDVPTLRDASLPLLENNRNRLPTVIYKRAHHVVTENMRVKAFCEAMRMDNVQKMGELINESHASLRDDFEVSSSELNVIVDVAKEHPQCLGARMMGAGFGGCALAIITGSEDQAFISTTKMAYFRQTGIQPHIFSVSSGDGAHLIAQST